MRKPAWIVAALFGIASFSSGAVVDVSPSGFVIRHEAVVEATPEKVYRALTAGVGSWWNPEHTRSKDSRNLSIDARPGGCFCEKLPHGGVEHMRVVMASAPELLRMAGSLGPLQEAGLAGSMTWTLSVEGSATKVTLTYSVGGYFRGGFEKIAPAVDAVMGEQLSRLRTFVETGSPTTKIAATPGRSR